MSTDPAFDGPEEPDPKEGDKRSETAQQQQKKPPACGAKHLQRVREVFEQEHERLVHTLARKTGSLSAARDIADQVFVNVLEIAQRGSVVNVKAYVYKAALNQLGKIAKAAAYRRGLEHLIAEPSDEHTMTSEAAAQHAKRLRRLQEAIEALPARVRMALIWRFWDDVPYEDIAERLGRYGIPVHERTVKRWIVNALEFCRQRVMDGEEDSGEKQDLENSGGTDC